MVRELALAQSRLQKDPTVDWWFLLKRVKLPLLAGNTNLALPADYERLADQTVPMLLDLSGAPLRPMARAYYEDGIMADTDAPTYYVPAGLTLSIYPAAIQDYQVDLQYVMADVFLSDTVLENQWTKYGYQLLMCKAGIAIAQALQAGDALSNFVADYNSAYKELFNESFARADINFSQVRD